MVWCCGALYSTLPRVCLDMLMSGLVVGGWVRRMAGFRGREGGRKVVMGV